MLATVEIKWDDGPPMTLRDEDGGLWRVEVDAEDGTLAVAEILDGTGNIETADTLGMRPCGIATWRTDGTLSINRAASHGENGTEGKLYHGLLANFEATPNGWKELLVDRA